MSIDNGECESLYYSTLRFIIYIQAEPRFVKVQVQGPAQTQTFISWVQLCPNLDPETLGLVQV